MYIENVHDFYDFYKALWLKSLGGRHFFELEDMDTYASNRRNEPSGCRQVVCFDSRKWGRFGTSIRGPVRLMADGIVGVEDLIVLAEHLFEEFSAG